LAFIAVLLGVIALLRKTPVPHPWVERGAAYTIGSLAVFWVLERSAALF
jgi:hypothetical protein